MAIDILSAIPRIQSPGNFVFTLNGKSAGGWLRGREKTDRRRNAGRPAVDYPRFEAHVRAGMARLAVAPHVVEACLNHKSGTIRGVAAVYNKYSYDTEKRAALGRVGRACDEHKPVIFVAFH